MCGISHSVRLPLHTPIPNATAPPLPIPLTYFRLRCFPNHAPSPAPTPSNPTMAHIWHATSTPHSLHYWPHLYPTPDPTTLPTPHITTYIYIHIPIPHPYCSSFTAWAGDRDYSRRRYTITQTKRLRRRMQILRSRVVMSKCGLSQVTRQLRQRHKGIAARRNVECRSDRIGVYYNMGIRHTMYGLHCMPYDIHHTMYVIRCTPYDVRHTMYAIH